MTNEDKDFTITMGAIMFGIGVLVLIAYLLHDEQVTTRALAVQGLHYETGGWRR